MAYQQLACRSCSVLSSALGIGFANHRRRLWAHTACPVRAPIGRIAGALHKASSPYSVCSKPALAHLVGFLLPVHLQVRRARLSARASPIASTAPEAANNFDTTAVLTSEVFELPVRAQSLALEAQSLHQRPRVVMSVSFREGSGCTLDVVCVLRCCNFAGSGEDVPRFCMRAQRPSSLASAGYHAAHRPQCPEQAHQQGASARCQGRRRRAASGPDSGETGRYELY